MSVHPLSAGRRERPTRPPLLLDVATEVLVADPGATLAEVAEAAGMGRTTLHKHYATRDDLLRAVGHRAIDRWEHALAEVEDGPDGGLRSMTAAMIPRGAALSFLFRSPALDHDDEMVRRWVAVEQATLEVLQRARDLNMIRAGVPNWWLIGTFYSVVYAAAEAVRAGRLAPHDAPGLALETLLGGLGPS
jgi:AcrR family transcriptional regulator